MALAIPSSSVRDFKSLGRILRRYEKYFSSWAEALDPARHIEKFTSGTNHYVYVMNYKWVMLASGRINGTK